jgi:hypothetical protein
VTGPSLEGLIEATLADDWTASLTGLVFAADVVVGRIQDSLANWTGSIVGNYDDQQPDVIEIAVSPYLLEIDPNHYVLTIRAT